MSLKIFYSYNNYFKSHIYNIKVIKSGLLMIELCNIHRIRVSNSLSVIYPKKKSYIMNHCILKIYYE